MKQCVPPGLDNSLNILQGQLGHLEFVGLVAKLPGNSHAYHHHLGGLSKGENIEKTLLFGGNGILLVRGVLKAFYFFFIFL